MRLSVLAVLLLALAAPLTADSAGAQQADLIVVGNRGLTGIRRFLLGSVSSKVSEHAPCSVMIVRPD